MSFLSWRSCPSVRPLALPRCTAIVATIRLAMLTIASIRAVSSTTPPVAVVSGVTSRCTGRLSSTASP